MTSVNDTHLFCVDMLKARGETVLQPVVGKPMNRIQGYIKTQIPHKDAGSIFQDKDGMYGLFGDMGALHITGIKWEDLGLCDSRCWYEWMSPETYKPKTLEPNHECDPLIDIPVVAHRCNTCGRLHIYEVTKTVGAPYKLRKIGTIEVPE